MKKENNKEIYLNRNLNHKEILIPKIGYCMYVENICSNYDEINNLSLIKIKNYEIILHK